MNRIEKAFTNGKVFAVYVTAGDSEGDSLFQIVQRLVDSGINMLEIGMPFTDPIADGPVIQAAMQRSLKNGTTPQNVLEFASKIRAQYPDIPLILFTYYNPLLAAGDPFLQNIKDAGFDGILVVDLPLEESEEFSDKLKSLDLDPIYIVTPSTTDERLANIVQHGKGFIYYVCQKGTTGVREELPENYESNIQRISSKTSLPVLSGFGISNFESAKGALSVANGFVVGSAIVKMIGENAGPEEISEFALKIDPRAKNV